MKTNDQLEEQITLIGNRLAEMEDHLQATVLAQGQLMVLAADRIDSLKFDERAVLRNAGQVMQGDALTALAAVRQFREAMRRFSSL
jgi:hypothetical protein